jgi:hypothetical protein
MSDDLKARLRDVVIETDYCGFSPLMDEAADYIEALELALTQSRAETAAAYEVAARAINDRGAVEQESFGLNRATQNFFRSRDIVRALATPDQTAALNAVRAEAMREAAVPAYQFEGNDKLRLHILAAIKGAKA